MAGEVLGRLTIISEVRPRVFRVRCECGMQRLVYGSQLERGYRSCGCRRQDFLRTFGYRIQPSRKT